MTNDMLITFGEMADRWEAPLRTAGGSEDEIKRIETAWEEWRQTQISARHERQRFVDALMREAERMGMSAHPIIEAHQELRRPSAEDRAQKAWMGDKPWGGLDTILELGAPASIALLSLKYPSSIFATSL